MHVRAFSLLPVNRSCTLVSVEPCPGFTEALVTKRWSLHLPAILLLFFPFLLSAQETDAPSRPVHARKRIGLALSGGGALGLAHIGVLKYFEEQNIPVDAIAGTSMGGLVGGLFATGLNSREVEQVARTTNFEEIFRATPEYEDRPIAEKQDWHRGSGLTLRFQRNFSLPTGLNPGQPLALLLSRYTEAFSELKTFDDLPTPFRCVATDLTSASAYTLAAGSLPLSLRATMAVPGIFTPVTLGDRVLVDGGAVNNIPVDVARTMNTDVVIAVSLETAPVAAKNLTTLSTVLKQVVAVVVIENERRSLKQADLVIPVPFDRYTASDYASAEPIIAAGYKAAQGMADQLKPFELPASEYQQYLRDRENRRRTVPEAGRVIGVTALQPGIQADAQEELRRKLPGTVDKEKLEETLTGITAATSLPSAYYGWRTKDDQQGYSILLESRSKGGELLIRPSLMMQASGGEPTRTSLKLSWVAARHNSYKERVIGEATIGYDPGLRFEYYRPFDGKSYFIAPGFLYQNSHKDSYSGSTVNQFIRHRVAGTFYGGLGTWRFAQWRLGVMGGYDYFSKTVVTDGVTASSTGFANLESLFLLDRQDSGVLPSRGTRLTGTLGYSFRNYSFPYFDAQFSKFIPLKKGISAFALGRGATSFGRKLPYYDQFTAGGLADLSAFRYQEFHANTLATGGGGIYFTMPKVYEFRTLLAFWDEAGRFDLGSAGWQTHNSANTGLFLKTPLGPTGLVLSFDEDGRARLRFVFGRF
jgi:NTE family protein